MWTAENRPRCNRDIACASRASLTDEEWAHIEPLIPPQKSVAAASAASI